MKNKFSHKRVRQTLSGVYIFYPFGPILSKGFVTTKSDLIHKAIRIERRVSVVGFSMLAALYIKFHANKELRVAGMYVIFAAGVFACFNFGAKIALNTDEKYDQHRHGEIL